MERGIKKKETEERELIKDHGIEVKWRTGMKVEEEEEMEEGAEEDEHEEEV